MSTTMGYHGDPSWPAYHYLYNQPYQPPYPSTWWPMLPTDPPSTGWRCPNCGRGLAPTVTACPCHMTHQLWANNTSPLPPLDLTVWNNTGDASYMGNVAKGLVDNFEAVDVQQDLTGEYYKSKPALPLPDTPRQGTSPPILE